MISYTSDGGDSYAPFAVDLFAFSYFVGGINFVDIAYLTKENIQDGRLVYYRKKTGKMTNLPLQQKAIEILEKYNKKTVLTYFPYCLLSIKRNNNK